MSGISQIKNGNGANTIVWWTAAIAVSALLAINGAVWLMVFSKMDRLQEDVAALKAQMQIVIDQR